MKHPLLSLALSIFSAASLAQSLPPKQPSPLTVRQIHSGHSLTDPVFSGHYQNLIALHLGGVWDNIAKSTIPGSPLSVRWRDAPGYGQPDARHGIAGWELLIITEGVPLAGAGGSSAEYLSLFVNNAWNNGNNGNGTPTLLWTTWTNIDDRDGPWRQRLDSDGTEWERLQDHANANRPSGAPPVYIIPGHKMMARLYDDIQMGRVPGITNISQFFADNIHLNQVGAYAFAMIHYACIYNTSPVGLPNNLVPNSPSHNVPAQLATYLQTMIWDVVTSYPRTGIHLQADTTNPSVPTGLTSSAITASSFTVSWTASTDNRGVAGYDVYVNGNLDTSVAATTVNLRGLNDSTTYAIALRARDAAGNTSAASTALQVTTRTTRPGSAYRYLRLVAQGGVSAREVYLREIDWMVGSTAYPQNHSSSGPNDVSATQNPSAAWTAYDGNNATMWSPGATTYPYSITVDLGEGVAIAPTAIQIAIEWNERAFSAFTCEGSNDNANWTTLFSKTGLTGADWTRDAANTFAFSSNPTSTRRNPSTSRTPGAANLRMERGNLSLEAGAEEVGAVVRVASIDGALASSFRVGREGPQSFELPSAKSGVWVVTVTRLDGSSWSGVRLAR